MSSPSSPIFSLASGLKIQLQKDQAQFKAKVDDVLDTCSPLTGNVGNVEKDNV